MQGLPAQEIYLRLTVVLFNQTPLFAFEKAILRPILTLISKSFLLILAAKLDPIESEDKGNCSAFVGACHPKAFTGRICNSEEPRDMRFNVHRRMDYRSQFEKEVNSVIVFGMSIQSYPVSEGSV